MRLPDARADGVVVVVPPWPYSGSANIFAAQVAAHATAGRKVFVLIGPLGRAYQMDQTRLWSHLVKGMSFPDVSCVRYGRSLDTQLPIGSHSFDQWMAAGEDDAIAICARYAAEADLPLELFAFIRRHRVALVHVNHCFEARLGRRVADLVHQVGGDRPVILLDTHDVQARSFHAGAQRNPHTGAVDSLAALSGTELALCRLADVLIHCAPADMAYFRSELPDLRHALLFPALDPSMERELVAARGRAVEASYDFLYVGDANAANVESVAWLLDEVVPRVDGCVRIAIAGAVGGVLRDLRPDLHARYGDMLIGLVPMLGDYYSRSRFIIAPAVSGTGSSIKLMEALCSGKPIVATSHALRGLPHLVPDASFLLVCDSAEPFAAAMTRLIADGGGRNGRGAAFFDQEVSGSQYAKRLQSIVRKHGRARSLLHRIAWPGRRAGPVMSTVRIDLASPSVPVLFRGGWHDAEPFGRWTSAGPSEILVVLPHPLRAPIRVTLDLATPAIGPVHLKVNGQDAGHSDGPCPTRQVSWRVEQGTLDRVMRLGLSYADATPPHELNPADSRVLGLAVRSITVEAQDAPAAARQTVRSMLMCKSFATDLPRVDILVRSILAQGDGAVPLVICIPHADLPAFRRVVPGDITLVAEEEFVEPRCFEWLDGWRQQQVVKLAFHRLDLCERYLAIDSDCYFIRPFREADLFGAPDEMRIVADTSAVSSPYGALDDDHRMALGLVTREIYSPADIVFQSDTLRIPDCFLRDPAWKNCPPDLARSVIPYAFSAEYPRSRLTCLPPPMLFSAKILAAFEAMIASHDLGFTDLIHLSPWEAEWYGHFALKHFARAVRTVTPFFKHYTTDAQVSAARRAGVTDTTLCRNYLGVNLAARHQGALRL